MESHSGKNVVCKTRGGMMGKDHLTSSLNKTIRDSSSVYSSGTFFCETMIICPEKKTAIPCDFVGIDLL